MKESSDIEEIKAAIHSIDITMVKQQLHLEEYTRRTAILEQYVEEDKEQFIIIMKHITQVKLASTIFLIIFGFAFNYLNKS